MIHKFGLSIIISCFCLLITFPSFGQEKITLEAKKVADFYPKNLTKSWAKGYLFKVGSDGELEVIGKKGENIEAILIQDEEAYKQFKRFKRKLTFGKVMFWTGVGTYATAWGTPYSEYTFEEVRRRSLIRLGTIVVGGTTTIIVRSLAVRNLKKSVEIYNANLEVH